MLELPQPDRVEVLLGRGAPYAESARPLSNEVGKDGFGLGVQPFHVDEVQAGARVLPTHRDLQRLQRARLKTPGRELGHFQHFLVELDAVGGSGYNRFAGGGAPERRHRDAEEITFTDLQIVAQVAVGAGLFQAGQEPPLRAAHERHGGVVHGGRKGRILAQRHGLGQPDVVRRLAREQERLHDHLAGVCLGAGHIGAREQAG